MEEPRGKGGVVEDRFMFHHVASGCHDDVRLVQHTILLLSFHAVCEELLVFDTGIISWRSLNGFA
jgi:hypothetical protein